MCEFYGKGVVEGHDEVSCDDGTVVVYLKVVWNSNGREGGSLSQRNCLMECPFSISILIKAWLTWDSITSRGTLWKARRPTRLRWTEESPLRAQRKTHSLREDFFQRQSTASECVLCTGPVL